MFQLIWVKLKHSLKQFSYFFVSHRKEFLTFIFFRRQRAEEKCFCVCVCACFLILRVCNHTILPRFDRTSRSSKILASWGESLGLCTITGDEPATNETVKWRWFWVVKWPRVIKSDGEPHRESVSLTSLSFPVPISAVQPGRSFRGDVWHFGKISWLAFFLRERCKKTTKKKPP